MNVIGCECRYLDSKQLARHKGGSILSHKVIAVIIAILTSDSYLEFIMASFTGCL